MNGLATRLAAALVLLAACHGDDDVPVAAPVVVAVAPPARTIVRIPPALPALEDTDEDVILDVEDRCPDVPDADNFDDIDGCPDPADYAVVTP